MRRFLQAHCLRLSRACFPSTPNRPAQGWARVEPRSSDRPPSDRGRGSHWGPEAECASHRCSTSPWSPRSLLHLPPRAGCAPRGPARPLASPSPARAAPQGAGHLTGFWAAPDNTRETAASIFLMERKQRPQRNSRTSQRQQLQRPQVSFRRPCRNHALNAVSRDAIGNDVTRCRWPTKPAPRVWPIPLERPAPTQSVSCHAGWGSRFLASLRGGRGKTPDLKAPAWGKWGSRLEP